MYPWKPSAYADIATLPEQRNAESQPARTHKDEQLKYAQHVDPQQRAQRKRRRSRRQPQQGTEKKENNGRQGHNQQTPGARQQPSCSNQVANTKKPVTATTLLSLLLFLHSFACRVKPDLHATQSMRPLHTSIRASPLSPQYLHSKDRPSGAALFFSLCAPCRFLPSCLLFFLLLPLWPCDHGRHPIDHLHVPRGPLSGEFSPHQCAGGRREGGRGSARHACPCTLGRVSVSTLCSYSYCRRCTFCLRIRMLYFLRVPLHFFT